jgi:hypothetical protein
VPLAGRGARRDGSHEASSCRLPAGVPRTTDAPREAWSVWPPNALGFDRSGGDTRIRKRAGVLDLAGFFWGRHFHRVEPDPPGQAADRPDAGRLGAPCMSRALPSIVLPTYNRAADLPRAVESVLNRSPSRRLRAHRRRQQLDGRDEPPVAGLSRQHPGRVTGVVGSGECRTHGIPG